MGFGIRNTDQGIRNPTKDWNSSSTDKDWNSAVPAIRSQQCGIQNPYTGRLHTEIMKSSRIRRHLIIRAYSNSQLAVPESKPSI